MVEEKTREIAETALVNGMATHAVLLGLVRLMMEKRMLNREQIGEALAFSATALLHHSGAGVFGAQEAFEGVKQLADELGISLDAIN